MNDKNKKSILPKFGGVLFSDNVRKQPSGKVDLIGVFTIFNSWAYPCIRTWYLTLTLYDSREAGVILVSIKKVDTKKIKKLAEIKYGQRSKEERNDRIISAIISNEFETDGNFEVICSLLNSNLKIINPLYVKKLDWPVFSNSEVELANNSKNKAITKINVQVNCPACKHIYVFEESILENDETTSGALRFPDNGKFECKKCDHIFNLKDLQGQIRYNIKDNLKRLK